MKKVLFMLSSMNIGGVEKSLLSLLSVMPRNKYDITVLLLEKKGGFLKYVPDWVKVEEVEWFNNVKPIVMQPPQQTIRHYFKEKNYFKIPPFIYAYMLSEKLLNHRYYFYKHVFKSIKQRQETYDIAISYQGPTDMLDFYIGNKVSAHCKISWIHFDVAKHPINKKLYEKMYRQYDNLFVVSKGAKENLEKRISTVSKKTKVFKNIVSNKTIHDMSKEPTEFDEDFEGLKIVTVGRLTKEKGQDLAIKVLARLRNEGYNVKWYWIGEGRQRKEYEELIKRYDVKDKFILMGARSNPYPYILNSDLYVQTSRHEGYCLTLAEARALSKPIITTDFTGAYEQITNGENGWIVTFSEQALYEKIKDVIDKPFQPVAVNHDVNTTDEVNKLLVYLEGHLDY